MSTIHRTYSIYVIELDDSVRNNKRFAEFNTNADLKKPCLYVGQTALSPEKRFSNHLAGIKSSRFVKTYGKRLRTDLCGDLANASTREEAESNEALLAESLREAGFAIWTN